LTTDSISYTMTCIAAILANDTAQHTFVFDLAGDPDPQLTTLATRWTSASESLATLTTAVRAAWILDILPDQDNSITLREVFSIGKDNVGTEHVAAIGPGVLGASAALFLPSNSALLVHKNTGLRGRRNRGRMYVPGSVGETEVNEHGAWTPATLATWNGNFAAFFASLDGRAPNSTPVILHSTLPDTPVDIVGMVVDPVIGTQRRRMR
jgi:hypothetical protein